MRNLSSRVHRLHAFSNNQANCYVKRDDELGCGISGTKLRKYASLIPHLINQGIRHLVIIAGPQSNNLLAALQVARELQLQVHALLLKPKHELIKGNFKLSRLFLHETDIQWIDRENWCEVEDIARDYLQSLSEPGFILSEGASVAQAMAGAMTLASDIIENEREYGVTFNHIFIDAGTGFSATALIKGMFESGHKAVIHVLLLADSREEFNKKMLHWIHTNPDNYECFYPATAKAFGSVNQTIKNEIKRMAYKHGILVDPIYSAKLFYETRRYIEEHQLQGNILIIHSGGTLTMAGFDL